MVVGWVIAIAGVVIALGCITVAIACLPWRVRLRWRKTWSGPLALQVKIISPGQWWSVSGNRRSDWLQVLGRWIWPSQTRNASRLLQQGKKQFRWLLMLRPTCTVLAWTIQAQFGFDDPSLTGECLGLLAAMPISLQKSISITFEQDGCRTRGELDVLVNPIAPIWRLIVVQARQLLRYRNQPRKL